MGKLYDAAREIMDFIDQSGLDVFRTRGSIAMKTGFLVTLVREDDPDDPVKLEAMRSAAKEILGIDLRA